MTEMEEKLEQLRKDDIEFFAKRYVELFAKDFDKTTPEQMKQFENEIKETLYKNAPIYVVNNSSLSHNAAAESRFDKIILSDYNFDDKGIRIHELVHSYNHISKEHQGLRDFEQNFVLKSLDEGSTEMIAQLIMGNEKLENPQSYATEVELTNFLTHLVGEKVMLQATRGKPQLLSKEVDRILGTTDLLKRMEIQQDEYDSLLSQSWGEDRFWGEKIADSIKIMSKLKLEVNRGNDIISMLYDAVEKRNDPELKTIFYNVDDKYGYNYSFLRSIRKNIEFNPTEPTIASVQQEQLRQEIQQLSEGEYEVINELKIELLKYLYDQIDFQRHFVDKTNYEYGMYNLTPEDISYCENFKSSIDGKNVRLGGRLGIDGVGNKVYELNNVIFKTNREFANQIYISELGLEELTDKRLEIISEQLLIVQQKEILKEWKHYIKNCFLEKEFDFFDDETLYQMIDDLLKEVELKEQNLFNKYRNQNTNIYEELQTTMTQQTNEQQQEQKPAPISVDKAYIEKTLKTHLDIVRGYKAEKVNGQEMYMPVLKTTQQLSQEQGNLFQKVEELYDNGQIDFVTKREIQAQLSKEFDILREKVMTIQQQEQQSNEQSKEQKPAPISVDKAYIEKTLKTHLDIVRGYKAEKVNGQEMYMPVLKTTQQLSQEQGNLFQKVEELYDNGQIDFVTKREIQAQLSKEFDILREKVMTIQQQEQQKSVIQSQTIEQPKEEIIDVIPSEFNDIYNQYLKETYKHSKGFYDDGFMTDDEKQEFEEQLDMSIDDLMKSGKYKEDKDRKELWDKIKPMIIENPNANLSDLMYQVMYGDTEKIEEQEQVERTGRRVM